jgi:hypothetical protein
VNIDGSYYFMELNQRAVLLIIQDGSNCDRNLKSWGGLHKDTSDEEKLKESIVSHRGTASG